MPQDPALQQLGDAPWEFEFPQALRILLRNSAHGSGMAPEERRYDVKREPVRIAANQHLGFPASDIQSLDAPADERAYRGMLINFLGLTGPSGVLPQVYTEFVLDHLAENDTAAADFFDIFNHRAAMLFYYAWEKYRFPVSRERAGEQDFFGQMLLSLVGLGTEYLQNRQSTSDQVFARYAALLAGQARSASALQTILHSEFAVPVEVQQFAGRWYRLDDATRFSRDEAESDRLGHGVVAGDEYWSREFTVRLRIGPLDLKRFRQFLPGCPELKRLREICHFFSRGETDFEVQLVLDRAAAPPTRLGPVDDSQLGWTTWARTPREDSDAEAGFIGPPLATDSDQVIIQLN